MTLNPQWLTNELFLSLMVGFSTRKTEEVTKSAGVFRTLNVTSYLHEGEKDLFQISDGFCSLFSSLHAFPFEKNNWQSNKIKFLFVTFCHPTFSTFYNPLNV